MGVDVSSDGSSPGISAEVWQALATRASDIVVILDRYGICASASRREWTGRHLGELVLPDDAAVVTALMPDLAAGPLWLRIPTVDGPRWLHAVSIHLPDGGWVVQLREPRSVDVFPSPADRGIDEVTGLASQSRALDELSFALSATPRTGREVAVAYCELDGFKELSSRLGPADSDAVLRVVALRIRDALRSNDLVARMNDDGFILILRGVHHLRGAIRVANKVRAAVEDPLHLEHRDLAQTISIGVTLISRGESIDSVLERADGALTMAKSVGRNAVMSSPPI